MSLMEDLSHFPLPFDVKIRVGRSHEILSLLLPLPKTFRAHSTVLSTRSVYFQNALSNPNPRKPGFITLEVPDISPYAFKFLLKYIYSGKLPLITISIHCIPILIAAINLQLQHVVTHVENHLIANESAWKLPNDFFSVLEKRELSNLKETAFRVAYKQPEIIFQSKYFPILEEEVLIQFLKRDDLLMDEMRIWDCLIYWGIANTGFTKRTPMRHLKSFHFSRVQTYKWTSTDFMNLKKTLQNCIPHIRFSQMSLYEYTQIQNKFKDILPNGLDDKVMQHFRDCNLGTLTQTNGNILPRRRRVSPKILTNSRTSVLWARFLNIT